MTRQKKHEDWAEKAREEIGKGTQMTALRFQGEGSIRHPRPPFGDPKINKDDHSPERHFAYSASLCVGMTYLMARK